MNNLVHVRPEVASLREQQSAIAPAEEPPADLRVAQTIPYQGNDLDLRR